MSVNDGSPQDTDEINFLIRSTSSLLNLLNPQVAESEKLDNGHQLNQLDGFALLFVTRPEGDSAAVATVVGPDNVTIYEATTDRYVSKMNFVPSTDWMGKFLGRDEPLNSKEHAAMLEHLINDLHSCQPGTAELKAANANLNRYVFYQALSKIQQRLHYPIAHKAKATFLDIILRRLKCANIGSEFRPVKQDDDLEKLPAKFAERDETWLHTYAKNYLPQYPIPLVPVDGNPDIRHLALDPKSIQYLFVFVHMLLTAIEERVTSCVRYKEQKDQDRLAAELDGLVRNMQALLQLTYHSASLWHLLGNKSLGDVLREAHVAHQKVVQDGVVDDEAEDENEVDEDEFVNMAGTSPRDAIMEWLKCLTQWNAALSDIKKMEILTSRPLKIHSIKTAPPCNPSKQASLEETLQDLYKHAPPEDLKKARDGLILLAKIKTGNKAKSQASRKGDAGLESVSQFNPPVPHYARIKAKHKWESLAHSGQNWEELFTGAIHCESALAWQMENRTGAPISTIQKCPKNIGVSRRCCFTCHIFLQGLNPLLRYTATHGKVYPWALPSSPVSREIQVAVLNQLQKKLRQYLDKHVSGRNSCDNGKGPSPRLGEDEFDTNGPLPTTSKIVAELENLR